MASTYDTIVLDKIASSFSSTPTAEIPSSISRISDGKIFGTYFFPDEVLAAGVDPLSVNVVDNTKFINPQANTLQILIRHSRNIETNAALTSATLGIFSRANTLSTESEYFIEHTGRLSGNIKIGTPDSRARSDHVPHLVPISSLGKVNTYINYVETADFNDTVVDPMYAGLFVSFESNVATLNAYSYEISSNLYFDGEIYTSNLTPQRISDISNGVNSIIDYVTTTRLTDESNYKNLVDGSVNFSYNIAKIAAQAQANIVSTFTTT